MSTRKSFFAYMNLNIRLILCRWLVKHVNSNVFIVLLSIHIVSKQLYRKSWC